MPAGTDEENLRLLASFFRPLPSDELERRNRAYCAGGYLTRDMIILAMLEIDLARIHVMPWWGWWVIFGVPLGIFFVAAMMISLDELNPDPGWRRREAEIRRLKQEAELRRLRGEPEPRKG